MVATMAAKKRKAQDDSRKVVMSLPLPGKLTLDFARPDLARWDRYLEKLRRNQDKVGARELVQNACVSHTVEQAAEVLNRFPLVVRKLSDALDDLCGGNVDPDVDIESGLVTVEIDGTTYELHGPSMDEWEQFQESMENKNVKIASTMRELLGKLSNGKSIVGALEANPCSTGPLIAAVGQLAGAGFDVVLKKG